jgi:hypothetical protein
MIFVGPAISRAAWHWLPASRGGRIEPSIAAAQHGEDRPKHAVIISSGAVR